jgi:hypothetical protein
MDLIIVDDQKISPVHRVLHTIYLVETFAAKNVHKFHKIVGMGHGGFCVADPLENYILVNIKGISNIIDLIHRLFIPKE